MLWVGFFVETQCFASHRDGEFCCNLLILRRFRKRQDISPLSGLRFANNLFPQG